MVGTTILEDTWAGEKKLLEPMTGGEGEPKRKVGRGEGGCSCSCSGPDSMSNKEVKMCIRL